jgi:hypothetical protein
MKHPAPWRVSEVMWEPDRAHILDAANRGVGGSLDVETAHRIVEAVNAHEGAA